ncbi:MAG: HDIG domain-containing protein [Firmicutes bacterium]|nr:HDIG domain-containing protein [Bacillota bacterium]
MPFNNTNKKDKLSNFIKEFFNRLLIKQILVFVIFTGLLFTLIVNNIAPEKISVQVGEFAPKDIRATKDIIDKKTTEDLKKEAMEKVEPRHRVDPSIQVKVKNEIRNFFNLVYNLSDNEKDINLKMIEQESLINITEKDYMTLLNTENKQLQKLETYVYEIVNQIMGTGIKEEEINFEKENVSKIFNNLEDIPKDLKLIGEKTIKQTLKPNRFLDTETTKEKRMKAANEVESVVIKKGQLIVRQGEQVTQRSLELIKSTGLLKESSNFDYKIILGSILIVIIFELIIIGYLYILDKEILKNIKKITMLSIIILSIIVISKTVYNISPYLLPVSAAAMLISILTNPKLSILLNFVIVLIIGLITGNDINVVTMCMIGGIIASIGVIKTNHRHNLFIVGFVVGLVNIGVILSFGLIDDLGFKIMLSKCIYGMLNGVFSAILTIGSLPLWEGLFGIITPLKLLELSNPNHPLQKKLLLEAPGTYHHSIVVGNLSEAAAEAVGGNSLIARAGAYYHDVGKLKRPYFFRENQLNNVNPHDKINPNLSSLIIINHTKNGVDMAKKYNLPKVIENIIREHHGNTLVAYFYHKALNSDNSNLIQEESFRYKGPKPQSKESAIIMLADSVEAAVRSMQEPTKGKIEGKVREIIKDKLEDGQLDECDLTLKDLNTIAKSFLNILIGIFHERIEYPKLDLSELKGGV